MLQADRWSVAGYFLANQARSAPMPLSAITDPAAVRSAIAEYDLSGRDAFLHRYGFGRAREYFLIHEGREYDSKAILGAAHGYQFPDRGPLRPTDFSGGEAVTAPKLRDLGFEVRRRRGDSGGVGQKFWALVANPAKYDIDAALAAGGLDSWTSRGRPLKPGDGIILWRTRDRAGRRGVVAIGEVVGALFHSSDEHDPYWLDQSAAAQVEARVPIRLFDAPGLPLWLDGEHEPLLRSLNVSRATGGTVFHVTREQWTRIRQLAGIEPSADELVEEIANPLRGRGQGRGLSGAERKVVELHAMSMAKAHYGPHWDSIEDVSSRRSYDLECRSGDRFLRVEVKGTTGSASSVFVTANEVEHARATAGNVALFVVSEIVLQRAPGEEPSASGGSFRVFEPWDIGQCSLRPVAYECTLPADPSP